MISIILSFVLGFFSIAPIHASPNHYAILMRQPDTLDTAKNELALRETAARSAQKKQAKRERKKQSQSHPEQPEIQIRVIQDSCTIQ